MPLSLAEIPRIITLLVEEGKILEEQKDVILKTLEERKKRGLPALLENWG